MVKRRMKVKAGKALAAITLALLIAMVPVVNAQTDFVFKMKKE